jgi:RNA polymerase sigma factor (sigma-70 family)
MENNQILALIQEHIANNPVATKRLWDELVNIGIYVFRQSRFTKEDKEDLVKNKAMDLLFPCRIPQNETAKSYIFRSFKNHLIDKVRKNNNFTETALESEIFTGEEGASVTLGETIPSDDRTDALLISRENRAAIEKCLSVMGQLQVKVLRLHLFEGLNNSEIAERLGIKKSQVETAKSHGLERLRVLLKKYFNIVGLT